MRNDVCWKDWMIWAEGALQDDFLESVFFTGNGRMGVRGYAAGDPQPRPVRQGLFLAGMFDEIKPGITDFIHLPTPVWHRILAGGPALAPTCLTAGRACISVSTGTAPRTAPMCAAIPPEGYRQASSSARNEQRQIFRKRADV